MSEGKDAGIDSAILDEIDVSQIKNEKLRVFLEKMKNQPRNGGVIATADYTKLIFEKALPPPPPQPVPPT